MTEVASTARVAVTDKERADYLTTILKIAIRRHGELNISRDEFMRAERDQAELIRYDHVDPPCMALYIKEPERFDPEVVRILTAMGHTDANSQAGATFTVEELNAFLRMADNREKA